MPYDLFISYSRRDNEQGRITQLVERIKADFAPFAKRELVTFFDQQEIHGMSDWRQRILRGLRESRLLLACLSPAYLKSEYCEWEFVEYLKYEIGHLHGFNGVAPIYFVEVPGWESKDFEQQCAAWVAELRKRQHFDLRPWHDQGEAALRETAVQERMGKLNRQIVQTITRGERAEKSLGNVDAHNPHFIGRTANLRMLRENFVTPGQIGVVTAVNGVGGLGKTALAIEYAHAFADEYGGGRWQVRCAGKDDLRLALAELATPIGFEFTDDEKKNADLQFERTRRELKKLADARAPHRCLLLLDNVDRPGLLDPVQVARLNGGDWLHVLATTRLGENELHGSHKDRSFLAIDELPPDDALALIESYQPDGRFRSETERDAAREIVRLLGSFTLAVESAAVYLGQFANDVTCAAFLARLKKEGLEGLDIAASQSSEGVLHGEKRLSVTLQPTLERLGAAEKLALEFAALLPPDQVPLPWLRALVAKTFPEMEHDAEPGYPDPWKNVLRRLFSLRLLTLANYPEIARIHRMFVAFVSLSQQKQGGSGVEMLAARKRIRTFRDFAVKRARRVREQYPNHAKDWEFQCIAALVKNWMLSGFIEGAPIAFDFALVLVAAGQLKDAVVVANLGLALEEDRLGSALRQPGNRLHLAEFCIVAAATWIAYGDLAQGKELLIRADDFHTQEDVSDRIPDWVTMVDPKARELDLELVMRGYKVSADIAANRGIIALAEGNFEQARDCFQSAVNHFERDESAKPALTRAYNNLAVTLTKLRDYPGAKEVLQKTIALKQQEKPGDEFYIATSLCNLARAEIGMRNADAARYIAERALRAEIDSLGPEHPSVAETHMLLFEVMTACGENKSALEHVKQAHAILDACHKREGHLPPHLLTLHQELNRLLR